MAFSSSEVHNIVRRALKTRNQYVVCVRPFCWFAGSCCTLIRAMFAAVYEMRNGRSKTDLLGHDVVGFLRSLIHLSTIEQHYNKLLTE